MLPDIDVDDELGDDDVFGAPSVLFPASPMPVPPVSIPTSPFAIEGDGKVMLGGMTSIQGPVRQLQVDLLHER